MKNEKRAVFTALMVVFVIFLANASSAQNLLINGGFDDDSGWIVYDMGSNDPSEYEFGFTADTCLFGSGPCLNVFGTSGYTNIIINHQGFLEEDTVFLQKPFSLKDFALKVRRGLGK